MLSSLNVFLQHQVSLQWKSRGILQTLNSSSSGIMSSHWRMSLKLWAIRYEHTKITASASISVYTTPRSNACFGSYYSSIYTVGGGNDFIPCWFCTVYPLTKKWSVYIWRALFQNAINVQIKKKMSSSCHFAVYWTYSLLHQCFMPNHYISLFKMYCKMQFFSKPQ